MSKCQYKHDGIETCNILVKDNPYSDKYCYFHQVTIIINEIYRLFEEKLFYYDGIRSYNLREGINQSQEIRDTSQFGYVRDFFNKYYPDFWDFMSHDKFIKNFKEFLEAPHLDQLNTTGFYFPFKQADNKNATLIIYLEGQKVLCNSHLIIKNVKYYDIGEIRKIFDKSYRAYRDSVIQGNYVSSIFFNNRNIGIGMAYPTSLQFSNIIFNKNLIIDLYSIQLDLLNCDIKGEVIDIKAASFNIQKGNINNDNAIISLDVPIVKIDQLRIIGTQLNIKSDFLSIVDSTISDIRQKIEIETSFYSLYLSNDLILNPMFLKTKTESVKVDIYDTSKSNIRKQDDFIVQDASNRQLKIPKEFITAEVGNTGVIRNVDLRQLTFHDNSRQRDNYNPENLNKLQFVHCTFNKGNKLYEEGHFKRLEYCYRYLRKHFDEKGDYIEGNDFHYNYMEAKRKNTKNWWDKIWLGLYGLLNGYNTRPTRTFIALLILIAIITSINACYGSFIIKDIYDTAINKHDWYTSLLYSTANIIPLINKDTFIPRGTVTLKLTMIENLLGPILIALLVMALRNRFRRSKSEDEFK